VRLHWADVVFAPVGSTVEVPSGLGGRLRPHVRIFPLVFVILLSMAAVAAIPVDANERRCVGRHEAPECQDPDWQLWFMRLAEQGY
jgi:hypothetical protein